MPCDATFLSYLDLQDLLARLKLDDLLQMGREAGDRRILLACVMGDKDEVGKILQRSRSAVSGINSVP